jgi:DNA-binding MltR family transcriptional regulator
MSTNETEPKPIDVSAEVDAAREKHRPKSLDDKMSDDERAAFYDHSSPRAMAILLGTIVENRLTELVRMLMRRDEKIADELFHPSGPLGPFGTKIRLAYMLRIVSPETYRDLTIISKIRNKFAHDLSVTSFEDRQISDWIKNMHLYGLVKKMSEEASARLKSGESGTGFDKTRDFIMSNATLSFQDSYRDCLRFMIHHLSDDVSAIREAEAKLNAKQSKPG